MKYDEKRKEQKYYNEQKERIELFMKYNVKGYRTIHFTAIEKIQWMAMILAVI